MGGAVSFFYGEDVSWMDNGSCAQVGGDWWFPEETDSTAGREARLICMGCDVRKQCLSFAVRHHEDGVWGGTTPNQRVGIRMGRDVPVEQNCRGCGRLIPGSRVVTYCTTACHQRTVWQRQKEEVA